MDLVKILKLGKARLCHAGCIEKDVGIGSNMERFGELGDGLRGWWMVEFIMASRQRQCMRSA